MFSVRGVVAQLAAAATLVGLCCVSARADGFARNDDTFLYFSGVDLWTHGSFSYGGMLWSPGGLDRDGFTFKALIGTGSYQYTSGALGGLTVTGQQFSGFVLPGWRFVRDKTFVTVFAGLDLQHHWITPYDPASDLLGSHAGIRGAIEVWHEPNAATMIAADATVSSIGPSFAARAAYGWRVADAFYIGPEIGGFASRDTYQQFRAGLHVTGFRFAWVEWSAAFGWAMDSDDRDGFYARLGLHVRR
ncbi:cellulose biosynthesis protein BcsS [Pseudorhodoplanes sp.]|uniref:cellulose biosynthesis protein BcsS n=1 Tax=Pseudorhodoplanes sp. TaxID=1934341 RepID=UPI002BBC65C2|nr:cellulose biosynthesis protein BcsS [Pseudorhodoplanes sp.]HWV51269.1 cellulose biosynthesis protein BcsS [Pseudorhodoplanes sp.]